MGDLNPVPGIAPGNEDTSQTTKPALTFRAGGGGWGGVRAAWIGDWGEEQAAQAKTPRCRQGSSSPGQQGQLRPERLEKGHHRYVLFQTLLCTAWMTNLEGGIAGRVKACDIKGCLLCI